MKEIKVKMTNNIKRLASAPIRTKSNVIDLILESATLLLYGDRTEEESDLLVLRIDKMQRLFFIMEGKLFSFFFPFSLDEDNGLYLYDLKTRLNIDAQNISILKILTSELLEKGSKLEDYEAEICHIIDNFDSIEDKNEFWEVLKSLVEFEAGYLRFDYDPERENEHYHPLYHLDVNYSSGSTFKLGLESNLRHSDFVDILDTNTECLYIR